MNRTQLIQRVQDVCRVGHVYLETTMGYLHAEATRVRSPLDVA